MVADHQESRHQGAVSGARQKVPGNFSGKRFLLFSGPAHP
jgi:hypothetical protein